MNRMIRISPAIDARQEMYPDRLSSAANVARIKATAAILGGAPLTTVKARTRSEPTMSPAGTTGRAAAAKRVLLMKLRRTSLGGLGLDACSLWLDGRGLG